MKKLKSILLSVCMLGTVCSFTGCGDKWEVTTEDNDNDEIAYVSTYGCSSIVSDDKKEDICKSLEKKYKNAHPDVTDNSIKGLLKKDIPLEKDGTDFYSDDEVRAEELDSIFEIDGHTVETFVSVGVYTDDNFMEYEIYAQYDNDEDTYCFAEIDFAKSE